MKLRITALLLVSTASFASPSFAQEGEESSLPPAPQSEPIPAGDPPPSTEPEATESAETDPRAQAVEDSDTDDASRNTKSPERTDPVHPHLEDAVATRENDARDAFRRGDRLYLEGDYESAVVAFEKAYALSGRIEMLFNLANAHERLGNYSEASVALRGYVPHSPEGDRPALERRLERFETLAKKEKAEAEETARTAKELQENPQPFPVTRTMGIGLITLGTAATINGISFAISAGGARKKLNDLCEGEGRTRLCPAEAEMPLDRDKMHSLIADISLISGAILGATGVYLVVTSHEARGSEIQAGFGPASIRVRGTF